MMQVIEQNAISSLQDEMSLLSCILSHDLRDPLRIIQRNLEQLVRQSSAATENGHNILLRESLEETRYLHALLDATLEYTRIGAVPVRQKEIDIRQLIQEALQQLSANYPDIADHVQIHTQPVLYGCRAQLLRLFVELIDNAYKFRGDQAPQIQISCTENETHWQFSIQDNGIGVEPDYQEIVFVLFQRAYAGGEYPGIGAGLALARKIVEAHAGNIMLQSTLGVGSCVSFSLAKRKE